MKPLSWIKFLWIILLSNFRSLKVPYKIFLVVTKSCGSRCANCFIWKEEVENELTLDEFDKIAKGLNKNLYWLNVSGGEPTDRDDLPAIIDSFVKNCPNLLCLNLTTNALNLDKLIELRTYLDTISIPVIRVNISVDGPPKIHDKIRGTPSGHEKAIQALNIFKASKRIKTMAAMTLHDSNKDFIAETYSELKARVTGFHRKDFHVNLSHHSEHYYGNRNQEQGKSLPYKDINNFFSKGLRFVFSPVTFIETIYRLKIKKFLKTGKSPVRCTAMSGNLYISERGDLYPCTIWNKKIDGLREKKFDLIEILNSQNYSDVRKEIIAQKCPGCWTPCEAYPSIMSDLKGAVLS